MRASLVLALSGLVLAGSAEAQPTRRRALTPADLLMIERIDEVMPAPDGRGVAIAVVRARTSAAAPPRFLMSGYDRADVWLSTDAGGTPAALTDGATDGAGFYFPAWAPDGRRLALLSTRGGGITLWVWNRATGRIRQLTTRSVEHARPVWLSSTRLVCAAPPEGRAPLQSTIDTASARHLMAIWPQAFASRDVTASVVRSPVALDENDPRLEGELLEFDVETGGVRALGKGAFTSVTPSPDGHRLAAAQATRTLRPSGSSPLPNVNPTRYQLVVLGPDGKGAPGPRLQDIAPGSLRWEGNDTLLVSAYDGVTDPARPVRLRLENERFVSIPVSDSQQTTTPAGSSGDTRATAGSGAVVTVWPAGPAGSGAAVQVLRRTTGSTTAWEVLDTTRRTRTTLPAPQEEVQLAAFDPLSQTAYFREVSRHGSRLYSARAGAAMVDLLLERNTFLNDVAEGSLQRLTYVMADGSLAVAWLLLPPDSQPGTRHPAVVWVYGGLVYGDAPPPYFVPLNSAGTLNVQVLAARGYAVLLPSMPLGPDGTAAEPLAALPGSVLPAIDAAIASGHVDGDRLAVMGHSFGGYAAYALITQTERFRTAIVMAGASNLVSLYGQFDPRVRHLDTARNQLLAMVFAESGQYRMGGPPSADMDRYLRNSPITHAHRVSTPTLIVQGDLDYVPIQQGEEFFTALYRRGVPAEFVRYWGEGHTIESPPNILDLWERVFDWLGVHLR